MNKDNAKDYLPLVQALAEGRVIEMYWSNGWKELEETSFSGPPERYRIKPEPREIWVNSYASAQSSYVYASEAEAKALVGKGAVTRRYREVVE